MKWVCCLELGGQASPTQPAPICSQFQMPRMCGFQSPFYSCSPIGQGWGWAARRSLHCCRPYYTSSVDRDLWFPGCQSNTTPQELDPPQHKGREHLPPVDNFKSGSSLRLSAQDTWKTALYNEHHVKGTLEICWVLVGWWATQGSYGQK